MIEASWDEPDGLKPRARVVIVPGRGEHPGVYTRIGQRLSADAYQVRVTADPTVASAAVADEVHEALAGTPDGVLRVLAGFDAGAVFAASLVASGRQPADALLLAGLLAGPEPVDPLGWPAELDARTDCPTHRGLLDADEQLRRGALGRTVPAEWFAAADLSRIAVPVLGVHGEDDQVSPLPAATKRYADAPRTRLVVVRAGRHDILNGLNHRSVAATITLFLEQHKLGATAPEIAYRVQ